MNLKLFYLIMILLMSVACSTNNTNPEKWTEEEVNDWFEKQDWLSGWEVTPDASINKRSLAIHYHKNPRHWNQAFKFLKNADLNSLPEGKQELEGEHLFIAVSEYNSKDLSETKYESHKKYIDIQYMISGKEKMGIIQLENASGIHPYDEENDLVFYNSEGGEYVEADQNNFLIFFPEDVHRPCVKIQENIPVKKIVVKILIEN